MAIRLFVGSLGYDVTEEQLKEVFAAVGTVDSIKIIMDRDTGQSKGFAFVEMSTDAEAEAAIKELNGKEMAGRQLTVNVARPMTDRGAGGGGGGGGNRGPRY